jgi:hypothetical protein
MRTANSRTPHNAHEAVQYVRCGISDIRLNPWISALIHKQTAAIPDRRYERLESRLARFHASDIARCEMGARQKGNLLPGSLLWLHWLISPFRLIWKALSGALRRTDAAS